MLIQVLQEVASAHQVTISCGEIEIDGYLFCTGLNGFEISEGIFSGLPGVIRPVTYLIRGASFRTRIRGPSTSIVSLGVLVDMYHTRKSTIPHDKVYALLGMSSVDAGPYGIIPDYTLQWKLVWRQLIEHIIGRTTVVFVLENMHVAVIESRGIVVGTVSSVESHSTRYDRQHVYIDFVHTSASIESFQQWESVWTLQIFAKSVRPDDVVCLLEGATTPTIIRICKHGFQVMALAATPIQVVQVGRNELQRILESKKAYERTFTLIWDWDDRQNPLQSHAEDTAPSESDAELLTHLNSVSSSAVRLYDIALILQDVQKYEESRNCLRRRTEDSVQASVNEDRCRTFDKQLQALIYKNAGNLDDAERILLEVVKSQEALYGENHQRTLDSKAHLTSVYIAHSHSIGAPLYVNDRCKITDGVRENEYFPSVALKLAIADPNVRFLRYIHKIRLFALLLGLRTGNANITEEFLSQLVSYNELDILKLVLSQRGGEIRITEYIMMLAARKSSTSVMKLLLDFSGREVQMTARVVAMAAVNYRYSIEMMQLLLDQRGEDIQITERVVETTAGSEHSIGVMELLLDQRGEEVQITAGVVAAAAAANHRFSTGMMQLLLDQRGEEVRITEKVVEAAAKNGYSVAMLQLLLDQRREEVQITERLLVAAAGSYTGIGMMQILLDQRGEQVQITEKVVEAAAGSFRSEEVIQLLLDQRGEEIQITERVLTKAAMCQGSGCMQILLDQRGKKFQITENVMIAAAKNRYGSETMFTLLEQRGHEIKITESVLKAAAGSYEATKKFRLLLEQRREEVQITEDVLKAAAGNQHGVEILRYLLEIVPTMTKFTEQLVAVAASNGNREGVILLAPWTTDGYSNQHWVHVAELHIAAREGDAHRVSQLIELGTPSDGKDSWGKGLLAIASEKSHTEVVRVLLAKSSADVDVENIIGMPPLLQNIMMGNSEIVRLLLDHGASPDFVHHEFGSPAEFAQQTGWPEMEAILIEHMAKRSGGCAPQAQEGDMVRNSREKDYSS
jgi:hypothetical protein